MFLRKIATRIIELDRGNLADWSCDYDTFLKRKEELLDAEEKNWSEFDKKLAREEVWIRQGIKARRTRNEGRVRALKSCVMNASSAVNGPVERPSKFRKQLVPVRLWLRP